jgi:hypothetical protein
MLQRHQERQGDAAEDLERVLVERDDAGLPAHGVRPGAELVEDLAVASVNPVEDTDGADRVAERFAGRKALGPGDPSHRA